MYSRMVRPATRIMGLARVSVKGISRSLRAAARITAFMRPCVGAVGGNAVANPPHW